jgi:hypothetical protein
MIGFDPLAAIGAQHTYLGKTWEKTAVGWKRFYPVPAIPAAVGTVRPLQVGLEIGPALEPLDLPWVDILVERNYGTEISATGLPIQLYQPHLITYI